MNVALHVELVERFTYLGSNITVDGGISEVWDQ